MKPAKTDRKAPKALTVTIIGGEKNKKQWGGAIGTLRQFKDGKGGMGYNFTARIQNPDSLEGYIFSGNLVLIGSAPKPKKGGKNGK